MFHVIERCGKDRNFDQLDLLFHGENVDVMKYLLDHGWKQKFKLIYCDPPFFSGTSYRYQRLEASSQVDMLAYDDKWSGDLSKYLDYLRIRVHLMRELLAPDGALWFHVGLKASHHVKLLLDNTFGEQQWINQIVWKKTNSPKAQSRSFGNQYDVILIYAKDRNKFKLNPVYKKPTADYLKSFSKDDGDGRGPYQTVALMAGGLQKPAGRKVFEFRGVKAAWLYSKEKLEQFWQEGRIYKTKSGKYRLKVYLKDIRGQPISDLWTDKEVAPLQGSSSEYVGFQTQKPKSLLQRIIMAGSNEGDLVGDFFVGSGTTAVVARELGRRWIVSDVSSVALHLTRKRLLTTSLIKSDKRSRENVDGKSGCNSNFALMESQVRTEEIMQAIDDVVALVAESLGEQPLNWYYWRKNKMHYVLDEKKCLHQGTDPVKLFHEVMSSLTLQENPAINILSHTWEFQSVQRVQNASTEKGLEVKIWCVPSSCIKNHHLLRRIKMRGKKEKNKTKKYLNDPLKPWPFPQVDIIMELDDSSLVLTFSKFEIPSVQVRSFDHPITAHRHSEFHLDYCAIELQPREESSIHPNFVFFSSKYRPIDWSRLKLDLSRYQNESNNDWVNPLVQGQLVFRMQCVDLLGRSLIGTFIVKEGSPFHFRIDN